MSGSNRIGEIGGTLDGDRRGERASVARRVAAILAGCLALGFALQAGPGRAADDAALTREPREIIEETARKVIAILGQEGRSSEERIREIEEIAYEIFDFTTMSKLVLAREWRKLERAEKREFVQEFKRHLSRTYGSRLDRYDQERVDVYAAQVEPRNDVTIKSRIVGGQFDGAEIAYRLRQRGDRWRIIDVVIEGVSLVSNYRSQFAEVLSNATIDELLTRLRDKNFTIEDDEAAPEASAS